MDHPLKPVIQRVRAVLLADPSIEEKVQYGTVTFSYVSDLCSFVQVKDKKQVSLMFNAAGRLVGEFPHLEGKSVKYMRFRDLADVDSRCPRAIVRVERTRVRRPPRRWKARLNVSRTSAAWPEGDARRGL